MPHAIYLQSGLTQFRIPAKTEAKRRGLAFSNRELRPAVQMVTLVLLMRCADLMGAFVNRPLTNVATIAGAGLVLSLNPGLLAQTLEAPLDEAPPAALTAPNPACL